ncbi:hypothetical protein JYK02_27270 [Corallococcus macrosporus]|uniref:Uncharacterized protein n=1 Tax=Corallococcus macrosporus TaxID=35 RepID=A0ABS3DIR2_9BACT|nr:hypothetical protein [Corallococcus macrosporus]MBN8231225.1 hypothetical protein [Corallococcus macrosporus]
MTKVKSRSSSPTPPPPQPPPVAGNKRKASDAGLGEPSRSGSSSPTPPKAEASTTGAVKKQRVEGPEASAQASSSSNVVASSSSTPAGKDSFTAGAAGNTPVKPQADAPADPAAASKVKAITQPEIDALPNRVLKDFAELGYGNAAQLLAKSPTAVKRLDETSNAGVLVREGEIHGRSHTARNTSTQKVTVYMSPMLKGKSPEDAAGTFMFEMNNAHRRPQFEALDADVRGKKLTSASDYAEKKMKLEVEGMLHTGMVGRELAHGGHSELKDQKAFYTTDYLKYARETQGKSADEKQAYRMDLAKERMDVQHNGTSHRQVYETQFAGIR